MKLIGFVLRAVALAVILGLGSSPTAQADGVPVATPSIEPSLTLPFTGTLDVTQPSTQNSGAQIVVYQGSTQGTLAMRFEAHLTPGQFAGGGRRQAPRSVLLKGAITVQDQAGTVTWFQGDAQATLNADGTGVLGIVAPGVGPYQGASLTLEANYTVDESGVMSGQLTGGMTGSIGPDTSPSVDHTYWFLSRAAGIVAYLLLVVSVLFGLGVKTRAGDVILGRWRVFDLHQTAALTAVAFLLLHMFSLLGDHYIGFTVSQLLVPFASPYRMVWVGIGIFAFYLVLILAGSFYVRRWITYPIWRALHYLTFLGFGLGLLHGILAGTDTSTVWARDMYWVTGALVATFTIYRMPSGTAPSSGPSGSARRDVGGRSPSARPPASTVAGRQ
jgi:hypothetical protein